MGQLNDYRLMESLTIDITGLKHVTRCSLLSTTENTLLEKNSFFSRVMELRVVPTK